MRLILLMIGIFILYPALEITTLIAVGGQIGILATLFLLFGMGVLGIFILRIQGVISLLRLTELLRQGILPAEEMLAASLLLLAGLAFLLPGILSDALGFLLLIPPLRVFIVRVALLAMKRGGMRPAHVRPLIIEGESWEEEEEGREDRRLPRDR